jgi:hypothetical protein
MSNVLSSDWPAFQNLIEAYKSAPGDPGVYIIAIGSPIVRFHGIDHEGIVDIGESVNLCGRLASFVGCARKSRKSGHMAGWRYGEYNFSNVIPLENLMVSWKTTQDKDSACQLEAALMRSYFSNHFELPPLNYKFNWE